MNCLCYGSLRSIGGESGHEVSQSQLGCIERELTYRKDEQIFQSRGE